MQRIKTIAIFSAGLICGLAMQFAPSRWMHVYGAEGNGSRGGIAGGSADCPADIAPSPDGDDQVNVDDLLVLLASWGACSTPDDDKDGWTIADGDCDDADPEVHPGALEVCNGIDDNCDEQIDEGFGDGASDLCASATFIGAISGDQCGGAFLTVTETLTPDGDVDHFRLHVSEDNSSTTNPVHLYARIGLTVPSSATSSVYMCVRCEMCESASPCLEVSPGTNGLVIVRRLDGFSSDDSFDVLVEISAASPQGTACEPYQLSVHCIPGTPSLHCVN